MGDTVEYYTNFFGDEMALVVGPIEYPPPYPEGRVVTVKYWVNLRKHKGEWFCVGANDPYDGRIMNAGIRKLLERNGFHDIKEAK